MLCLNARVGSRPDSRVLSCCAARIEPKKRASSPALRATRVSYVCPGQSLNSRSLRALPRPVCSSDWNSRDKPTKLGGSEGDAGGCLACAGFKALEHAGHTARSQTNSNSKRKNDTDRYYFVCCSERRSQVRFFVIHLIQNATATKTQTGERLVSLNLDSNPVDMLCGARDS